jgi:hypothetical protein
MYVNADTPVNCVFAARLRGLLTGEGLRDALDRVQSKHPLLRSAIREDRRGRPYFVADGTAPVIPFRVVDRRSDDDWLNLSEAEWRRPFDLQRGPLARVIWLRDGALSELLIVSAHCIADGMSFITLLKEILELLDNPDRLLEPYEEFHNVKEIVPPAALKKKNGKGFKAVLAGLFARMVFALKRPPRFTPSGKDYVIHWKLNTKASVLLQERCRIEGVSAYAALCVAFLESFVRIRSGHGHNKLLCPVDIRKMVPAIKEDRMFAFAPIIELSVKEDAALSFWDKARQMKKDIAVKVKTIDAYEMLLAGERFQPYARKLIKHLLADEGGHDFTFSNMGRLDLPGTYRNFEVETIYSATVAFPWRNSNTLVVSSFNGQMDFAFMSNTHSLTYEDAIEFKGKAIARLLEEMALVKAF